MRVYWYFLRNLLWPGVLAVPLGGLLVSALMLGPAFMDGAWREAATASFVDMLPYVLLLAGGAVVIGMLPALLVGVPVYAWLASRGWANVLSAALVGAVPGAVMFANGTEMARLFLIFGPVVGVILHLLARRDVHRMRAAVQAVTGLDSKGV
ncbi:hypothetical protein D8I35_08535 [Corticibacter populi]|uniref:Uncharacterized protein n=1 Tax=Corticibacter populi TaxID=1550736 RepID=A0A3M6QU65_9BURK|nr:hypothetical protein [Corticibacter populi]RMX06556.1 hypothetical protein D8I35_08535 [Corticibacter populi]RZS31879.1 hypothetical protein EV687_2558 [Corticibacter populi]